jgi:membrane-bound acyltransferase YfiQ involved in biofilm formation
MYFSSLVCSETALVKVLLLPFLFLASFGIVAKKKEKIITKGFFEKKTRKVATF